MLEHYGQASFKTQSYHDDNMEDHLFQDLPTKLADDATWFEKVKDGDGHATKPLTLEGTRCWRSS